MSDDDDNFPGGGESCDEISDGGEMPAVDARGGFIEDDDLLVLRDGGRDDESLGLPA